MRCESLRGRKQKKDKMHKIAAQRCVLIIILWKLTLQNKEDCCVFAICGAYIFFLLLKCMSREKI